MDRVVLQKDAGMREQPWLRSAVMHMQRALAAAGFDVDADGYFGMGTEDRVKAFQAAKFLIADGVVGPLTHEVLLPHHHEHNAELLQTIMAEMPLFRGDLQWVHLLEGHNGKPYWPGGASGVTLDPGIDLGHAKPEFIRSFEGTLYGAEQWMHIEPVLGLRGEEAHAALKASPGLQAMRISREAADRVMPFAAKPYWKNIVQRFPSLTNEHTLPTVQTVMLSLAYNRGIGNAALDVLRDPLTEENWHEAANLVGSMQQDHVLPGIRKRRRWEAALIRAELEWPG